MREAEVEATAVLVGGVVDEVATEDALGTAYVHAGRSIIIWPGLWAYTQPAHASLPVNSI